MTRINAKVTLTVLFASSLVIANATATKVASFDLPYLDPITVPAGFVAVGASFLFTDLLNELYGREYAQAVVNGSIVALVLAWGLIYVAIAMPAAPFYPHQEAYSTVLGGSATVVLASVVTLLISQNFDVLVFDAIRDLTGEGQKWARNIGSTLCSQGVDTILFIVLAFALLPRILGGEITPWAAIPGMIMAQYVMKLLVALLDTPLFYLGSWLLGDG